MATTSKPMPTIGVDKYTFFKVLTDTEDGTTYDTAQSLPGTVEIAPTDTAGSDVFDADNGAYVTESYVEKMGHDLTNADIPPAVDMLWRGQTLNKGVAEVSGADSAPYFGVAWRITKAGDKHRYVRYYKGKYSFASSVGGKTKPSSGAAEKQTATANYTAVQRDSDGLYYGYIDEEQVEELGVDISTFEEKWFSDLSYYPGT